MKTLFLCSLIWLLTASCEINSLHSTEHFQFVVLPSFCINANMAFSVMIRNKDKYDYEWELDGQVAGRDLTTPCVCGNTITLYVTRLNDGLQLEKSIPLIDCFLK